MDLFNDCLIGLLGLCMSLGNIDWLLRRGLCMIQARSVHVHEEGV